MYLNQTQNHTFNFSKDVVNAFLKPLKEKHNESVLKNEKLWFFLVAEHLILVVMYVIQGLIDEYPKWVKKYDEKMDYEERMKLKRIQDRTT